MTMIAEIICRALRILSIIIIGFAALLVLSRLLPAAGEALDSFLNFFGRIFSGLLGELEKLKSLVSV